MACRLAIPPRNRFAFKRRGGGDGACIVERHITLDRSMWFDHAASLEPNGITRLVRDIRLIEKSKVTASSECWNASNRHQKASARGAHSARKKPDKAPAIVARIKPSPWMSMAAHRRRRLVGPNGEEWKRFHFADIMASRWRENRAGARADFGRGQSARRSTGQ